MAFNIEVQKDVHPGVAFVSVGGHVGVEEAVQVSKAMEEATTEETPWVVVSMKDLEFICTAGIGALLYAAGGARRLSGDVIFIDFGPDIRKLFEFLDLHDYVITADSLIAAVRLVEEKREGKT
ncbi:MAG: STAS domain-containing protein [Candidatus Coatesbacteria bacterium]|nr:MAG: STAS domain-containing protein [Candidatus Coatesbacteria bacterium]